MYCINNIQLIQFRNYLSASFQFNERIVGICGNNGTGKTNLLDAIYYLSFTKSYLGKSEQSNIHHQLQGMRLKGGYQHPLLAETTITCIIRENGKKEVHCNDVPYQKYSEHIGQFPAVMIAPDDTELITGSSELRRKLVDTLLCQTNSTYFTHLIAYQKNLVQRNALLKQWNETKQLNQTVLDYYHEQLGIHAQIIFNIREQFLQNWLPQVNSFYAKIAQTNELVSLHYQSHLHEKSMHQWLTFALQKDMLLQRTQYGIHKDDIVCTLNNQPFKLEASQGQRKSLLFAFKLAEWAYLKEQKQFSPILLLDDVFEKLDEDRMHNLLLWVCKENSGQVFISDTHPERIKMHLEKLAVPVQLLELKK